jgi:hypothetical protein
MFTTLCLFANTQNYKIIYTPRRHYDISSHSTVLSFFPPQSLFALLVCEKKSYISPCGGKGAPPPPSRGVLMLPQPGMTPTPLTPHSSLSFCPTPIPTKTKNDNEISPRQKTLQRKETTRETHSHCSRGKNPYYVTASPSVSMFNNIGKTKKPCYSIRLYKEGFISLT